MITFAEMMDAVDSSVINALEVTAFSEFDIVNLILQRSEIVHDHPHSAAAILNWIDGDDRTIRGIVDEMGAALVRRAAAAIWLEYQEIKPVIDALAPMRMADIGCGYALFDLFAWQAHRADLLLIDLEQTEERHFGFAGTGSAYSNLETAKAFLLQNGVPAEQIACRNPERDRLDDGKRVDLAVSFISCGFHYPAETYSGFFRDVVADDGAVILDARKSKVDAVSAFLGAMGKVEELTRSAHGKGRRLLLRKTAT
ncbi:MAG: class I SAM-dependent methyltransferase [Pseudomonadota bacterium]